MSDYEILKMNGGVHMLLLHYDYDYAKSYTTGNHLTQSNCSSRIVALKSLIFCSYIYNMGPLNSCRLRA